MVGKYVLENWTCNGHVSNNLRYVNRETNNYYISDVQRTIKDYEKKVTKYVFIPKWATRYVKDNSKLGFKRSINKLANTEGVMNYTVLKSPSEALCKHTFEEVFDNDHRDIQHKDDYPLRGLLDDRNSYKFVPEDVYFKLRLIERGVNRADFDIELIRYLKRVFKVDKVYRVGGIHSIDECNKESILSTSSTLFQITICNINKKEITRNENKFNCTIGFWLFKNRLVFRYESGKKTW